MEYPITGNRIDHIDLTRWKIDTSCQLSILRTDINHINFAHPDSHLLNGNKLYKLKYNISYVKEEKLKGIVTFGGAFSNHLYATATAGNIFGFKTIGIVRGEEWAHKTNFTLSYCISSGMKLEYWSRAKYRLKDEENTLKALKVNYPKYLIVPEGGNNTLALKGTKEILDTYTSHFDVICSPIGTGGTLSGIYLTKKPQQQIIGFASVAMSYDEVLNQILKKENIKMQNDLNVNYNYTFGGFAKYNQQLIEFINRFKTIYNIQLEPLYTGKMLFGIFDMLLKGGHFTGNQKILAIHTGGMQGVAGFNQQNENCLH